MRSRLPRADFSLVQHETRGTSYWLQLMASAMRGGLVQCRTYSVPLLASMLQDYPDVARANLGV